MTDKTPDAASRSWSSSRKNKQPAASASASMSVARNEGQRAAAAADRDIAQVPVATTPVQAAAAPVQAAVAAHVEHVESESDAGGGGIIASKTSRALSFEKIDEKGVRKKSKDREKQKKDRKK